LAVASIGWGPWTERVGMTAGLDEVSRARYARAGIADLSEDRGLALFDRALASGSPQLLPAALDFAALRSRGRAGLLPPLFSGLVRVRAGRAAEAGGSLAARLAGLSPEEGRKAVLELVRGHVAAVLGHESTAAVDPGLPFKDLGFDSLAAVELRNRLGDASGMRLPSTLVFDHPTPTAVAGFLEGLATDSRSALAVPAVTVSRSDEPLAIVGISCHYPGGVVSPEGLWGLVASGTDAITPFPDDRGWDLERLYDPDPDNPGTIYASGGGYLADAAEFDAGFFGIGPREALSMDPQQRLLLEASWEALEDAGIDPPDLKGSDTGVFAGVMYHDYGEGSAPTSEGYGAIRAAGSVVSGRVAYTLGLEGPAVSIDTACSSSLVAIHLAAQALRAGECSLALAGGVTVMSTLTVLVEFARQRGLAPDGRCKAFGGSADGVGWSEGVGLIVLERLSEARRNGHEILATIRGSAVNQDGASNGLTAPNGPSQERVIRRALANAGLKPSEVDAVEAHGTGTTLGDPIEAGALLATYGQERSEDGKPLYLGSLKSNIGHTQAAAGVGGVIKTVLAMRKGVLPKTLHVEEPSTHVDWESGEIELLREQVKWEPNGHPRRAGVSAFGISGTNAHLILEEGPAEDVAGEPAASPGDGPREAPPEPAPLLVSAKAEAALPAQAGRLASHLRENPELRTADVAFSLATSRGSFAERAAVVAADREELLEGLDALAAGRPHRTISQGRDLGDRTAFVFPGQGWQWQGMARGLIEESPRFAELMEECEQALSPHLGWSVLEALDEVPGAPSMERIEVIQPALFAVSVSLAGLWRSYGVEPGAVIGHSQGEIAAACVAGALSLQDAALVAALRSKVISRLAGQGSMVSVALSAEQAEERLAEWGEGVEIAALNGPGAVTLACGAEAVPGLLAELEREGTPAREVPATIPSHSSHVEPLREELLAALAPISPRSGDVLFYSTVSGEPIDTAVLDASYWWRNLRQPVRFEQATAALLADGFTAFVEASAHPVLALAVSETVEAAGLPAAAIPSLRREEGGLARLVASLATAHCHGADVDWPSFLAPHGPRRVPLPTYAFQRRRYWLAPVAGGTDASALGQAATEHPLLAAATTLAGGEEQLVLSGRLSVQSHPWLADHVVHGTAILPGTAFVEMALAAGERAEAPAVEELAIEAPLPIPKAGAVQLQVVVAAADEQGRREIEIHSRPEAPAGEEPGEWERNASGHLAPEDGAEVTAPELAQWPPAGAEEVGVEDFYEHAAALGADFGPAFEGVKAVWRRDGALFSEVELPEGQVRDGARYAIHPALLDAALQAKVLVDSDIPAELTIPFSWARMRLRRSGATSLRVRLETVGDDAIAAVIADESGAPVFSIESLAFRPLDPAALSAASGAAADDLFALDWAEAGEPFRSEGERPRAFDCVPDPALDPPAAALDICSRALAAIQAAIEAEEPLAILTHGAQAAAAGDAVDPAAASVWGLVRSAQAEHPGLFTLVDSDDSGASDAVLDAALAAPPEPQLAIREGRLLGPRLVRAGASSEAAAPEPLDPGRTVLVTGGLSGVGALVARHLVAEHGVRRLLLVGRRGPATEGAEGLRAELEGLGAEVRIEACDVSERDALAQLLASIDPAHPLGAVVHSAVVLDDGLVDSMGAERVATAMAPKADAAWHLHELTRESGLTHFVLFSSMAATMSNPSQANYAAANAFLDGLAHQRRAQGMAAVSLAWGPWAGDTGRAAELGQADRARYSRLGFSVISQERGVDLFDRALALDSAHLMPTVLDFAGLRTQARNGILPPLFWGLVRARPRRAAAPAASLAARLAAASEDEREGIVLELVREHVAAILGHQSGDAIAPATSFKDLGFDSLAAVELRNRLSEAIGSSLPATLVFDYPTPSALAGFLAPQASGEQPAGPAIDDEIGRLEAMLAGIDPGEKSRLAPRLEQLLQAASPEGDGASGADDEIDLDAASDEELLQLIDEKFGP
jgi:acyl transferase domain-containing protein/acyl carrier protein